MFDLLDRRKLSSAMILTSNRDIEEWGEVFADPVLANAAIDRMFEAAKIVAFNGPSYRLKDRIVMQQGLNINSAPPKQRPTMPQERGDHEPVGSRVKLQRRK